MNPTDPIDLEQLLASTPQRQQFETEAVFDAAFVVWLARLRRRPEPGVGIEAFLHELARRPRVKS